MQNVLICLDLCLRPGPAHPSLQKISSFAKKTKTKNWEISLIILNICVASWERPGLLEGVMSTQESLMIHVLGLCSTCAWLLPLSWWFCLCAAWGSAASSTYAPHLTIRSDEALERKHKFCLFLPLQHHRNGSSSRFLLCYIALKLCVTLIHISEVLFVSNQTSAPRFWTLFHQMRLLFSHVGICKREEGRHKARHSLQSWIKSFDSCFLMAQEIWENSPS